MRKVLISIFMMLTLCVNNSSAQNVQRKGDTFIEVSTSKRSKGKEVKTQYHYKNSKGEVYPIYLSSSGKAFIKKVSKKTGKEYRQYLPEIGKQINPEAYKEK